MARVLVIDDSLLARQVAGIACELAGHELLAASDGTTGLDIARRERPDCMLLDWLMPDLNGIDVLRAMRQEKLATPVIVVTADVQDSTRAECLKLGAALVIEKPRLPEELMAAISRVLSDSAGGQRRMEEGIAVDDS